MEEEDDHNRWYDDDNKEEEEDKEEKMGGTEIKSTNSYIAFTGTMVPPFLGTSPPIMVSAFVVPPKTHLDYESSPHTLQAPSTYAWQQQTYFLYTMCM